jgi:hypothetical protein
MTKKALKIGGSLVFNEIQIKTISTIPKNRLKQELARM